MASLLGRRRFAIRELRRRFGVEEASRRFLLYFVVPLWIGAGLADWWRHRKTSIETTAGNHESVVHALQMTEGGVSALHAERAAHPWAARGRPADGDVVPHRAALGPSEGALRRRELEAAL